MCPQTGSPPNEWPQRRKWLTCPIWGHFLVKQTWFVYKSENRFTYRECDWFCVWVVQPLELFQVTASHLVLIQSKGPASPRSPRHCKAWATPPQLNISRSVMGLWTLWRTCCKVLLFELFVERHAAWTTLNKIPPCTTQSRHWQPLQAM